MALFRYEAVEPNGRIAHGTVEAADRSAAATMLQEKGAFPLRIEAGDAAGRRYTRAMPPRLLAAFAGELSVMLRAGLEIDRALATLGRMESLRRIAPALRDVLADVRAGVALSDAMARRPAAFPAHAIGMVRAGEAAGALGAVLAQLAELATRQAKTSEAIRSALIYPAILVAMAGVSVAILFTVVLPQLEVLFVGAEDRLPLVTVVVLAVGRFVRSFGPLILAAGMTTLLGAGWAIRLPRVRRVLDSWVLACPGVGGLVREIEAGRCTRMLAMLLVNGVPAARAIELAGGAVTNRVIAEGVETVRHAMVEGRGVADPLAASGLFPPLAVDLVRIGEESGRLGGMLSQAADILEADAERKMQRAVTLLVPLLTIGIGGTIAVVIAAVLMALLSVNSIAL